MFGFLNSFVLPALAAAAVPLIIHFFYRRRSKTVLFSSIRFLKLLESKRIKHLRIYQLLLVLIRMLFILALVAAFARPVIKSVFFSAHSANTTAVILLDDSYSMRAFTASSDYFQQAKQALKNILTTFSTEDKVYLLPLSRASETAQLLNPDYLKSLLLLNPGFGDQNLKAAFKQSFRLFSKQVNFNRELYLISDFRLNKNLFPDSLSKTLTAKKIKLFLLDPGQTKTFNNCGIDTVLIKNQIIEKNKPFSFSVRLQNFNPDDRQETRIHLFEGQKRLAMNSLTIPAGASAEVSFSVLPEHDGPLALHLELDNDDLTTDNFYYFNVFVAGEEKLLFAGNPLSEPLRAALNTLREQSALKISFLPFSRLKNADLNKFDALLLYDPPPPEKSLLYKLKRFSASGRSLLLLPGDKTNPLALNALLYSLTGQKPFLPIKFVPKGQGYFAAQKGFENSALFQPLFASSKKNAETPEIYRFYPLKPEGYSLIRLQNGSPLLSFYKGKIEPGKIYVFSSALNLKWNNLPLQGFFVPLLQRVFLQAGHAAEPARINRANVPLQLHFPGSSPRDRFALNGPSAENLPLNPLAEENGVYLSIKGPLPPGQYRVLKNGQPLKLFSVNIPAGELRRPYYRFKTSNNSIQSLQNGDTLAKTIIQSRSGYELWPIFVAIAFLLLLLEIILIKQIEGKNERTSD